jgi:hypothetical protein
MIPRGVEVMENDYQAAVDIRARDSLNFPSKCAFCLKLAPLEHISIKHKQLKRYALRVPYCQTHSNMIRYMKWAQNGALASALLIAVLLGGYFHNNRLFVTGSMGFNYLVAGFIGLVIFFLVLLAVRALVLSRYFAGQGSLDPGGAVEIIAVYSDAFVLHFLNKSYGTEFSQLNQNFLIDRRKSDR